MFLGFNRIETRLVSLVQNLNTPITYDGYKLHRSRGITNLLEINGYQMITTEGVKIGMMKMIIAAVVIKGNDYIQCKGVGLVLLLTCVDSPILPV
jgi:hypothetical protein